MPVKVTCKCGWCFEKSFRDIVEAEVAADAHEVQYLARAYRHSTRVVYA